MAHNTSDSEACKAEIAALETLGFLAGWPALPWHGLVLPKPLMLPGTTCYQQPGKAGTPWRGPLILRVIVLCCFH